MVSSKFLGVAVLKTAKFTAFAAAAFVAVGITACGGGVPACDGEEVEKLLTQAIKEKLQKVGVAKSELDKAIISYESFATNSTDKDAKKATCKVKITFSVGDKKAIETVPYSVQRTSDGLYVEVYE